MFNKVQTAGLVVFGTLLAGAGLTGLIIHNLWQSFLIGMFVALLIPVVRR